MKFLHITICLCLGLFYASSSLALENYRGMILNKENRIYIQILNQQGYYEAYSNDPTISKDLQRLQTNDFVNVMGEMRRAPGTNGILQVQSILFVGLDSLIGTWRSEDWIIFDFEDFTNLKTYHHSNSNISSSVWMSRWQNFHYSLAPANGNDWTIFIVDRDSINIGKLRILNEVAQLEVIDPDSGLVQEIFDLHRVR